MAPTLKQLREMPESEIVQLYDRWMPHVELGPRDYLAELDRRSTKRLTKLTWAILGATIVLGIFTIVLIVLTAALVARA